MPPPSTKRDTQQQSKVLRFKVQGTPHVLDWEAVTGAHDRELYIKAGITKESALDALRQNGIFGLAALIYLARRQAGEATVDYEAIETAVFAAARSDDGLDLDFTEDDTYPPAPGASS